MVEQKKVSGSHGWRVRQQKAAQLAGRSNEERNADDAHYTKLGAKLDAALASAARDPSAPLTLDSTLREVEEALAGVVGLTVKPAEGHWSVKAPVAVVGVYGRTLEAPAPWEASGLILGEDAHGNKVVTSRVSATAETPMAALVALANLVRRSG